MDKNSNSMGIGTTFLHVLAARVLGRHASCCQRAELQKIYLAQNVPISSCQISYGILPLAELLPEEAGYSTPLRAPREIIYAKAELAAH
jgi:hypothetical protein